MIINTQLFNLLVPLNVPFCQQRKEKGQSSGIRYDIRLSTASLPRLPLLHYTHQVRKTDVRLCDTKARIIYGKIIAY